MKKLVDDLSKIISKETELYESLLNVLHEENHIILNSSIDDLHRNNKEKEVLVLQIKLLDESCSKLLGKIQKKLPSQQTPASLKHVIALLKEPSTSPLNVVYSKLRSVALAAKEINNANDRLIRGSMRAIKSSMSFLMSCVSSGGQIYENNGQVKTDNFVRPILQKEV